MAFRGDSSPVLVTDGNVPASELATTVTNSTSIPREDMLRVRIAIALAAIVALVDCVLYLPRLF